MEKMKTFWVLFSVMLASSEAFKALVVFPMPTRSHANLGDGIVRHLLNAGHEVTYISPMVYKNPPANLRVIDVSANSDDMPTDTINLENIIEKKIDEMSMFILIYIMTEITKKTVKNENVQKLLNDPKEQFDAVISEWMFSDVPAGIADVLDCPLIWLSSVEADWMILQLIDEPSNPAYTVDILSQNTPPLSFAQRANELWTQLKTQFLNYFWLDDIQASAYESLFAPIAEKRGTKISSFHEARYNASMVLSNAYVSTSAPGTLPQSHKYIGGYHIDDTLLLPEDLKKLLDNAKDGFIYFSLGSSLQSKQLPAELKDSLLKMFGTLKQTVLWKFEEVLPNLPKNVHILEWAPQQEILSHPNLAVFITHGGLLSTTEAVHFGVPIIGIPVFADQFVNVEKAVQRGFAERVDLSYTMADELKNKILAVTGSKRYAEKAKELSFIHHDRPVKPGQELVHWVTHVVNTGGAPHLRSPAVDLPFYKRKFLDLAAVMAVLLLAVYILLKRACTYICSKLSSSKGKTGSKKNN